jgi:GGDEF domain-containing protein
MQTVRRREAEKAFDIARLPQDFSAHGELSTDESPFMYNFFKCQNEVLTVLARSIGFDLSMVVVRLNDGIEVSHAERQQVSRAFKRVAKNTLRKTDRMFDLRQESHAFTLVLPGTRAAQAEVVIDKIRRALNAQKSKMSELGQVTFSVEALHETEFAA